MVCGGLPQQQVVFKCSIKKDGILHEVADSSSKTLQSYIANIDSIYVHRSSVGVVQPSDNLCNGALAAAADSDERDLLAGLEFQAELLQDWLPIAVGERDIFNFDMSFDWSGEVNCLMALFHTRGHFDDF